MVYIPKTRLSASKLKTYIDCSEVYASKYIDKLPDIQGLGACLGSEAHSICELLLNKQKYEKYVNKIIKSRKFPSPLSRLIEKNLKKTSFYSKENIDTIKQFILVALDNDFWIKGGDLQRPEEKFEIKKSYWVTGFIDKYAIFKDKEDNWICVDDLKSQQSKFSDLELSNNLQAFIYLIAVKNKHPEINLLKSKVRFVLLRHPESPIQEFKLKSLDQIKGFEDYLDYVQVQIDNFKPEDRDTNLAAKMGWTPKEEGFKGLAKCGRAKFDGDMKKDGKSKQYFCQMKFPSTYFAAKDKDGNIKASSFDLKELDKYREMNYDIFSMSYRGCPFWNK